MDFAEPHNFKAAIRAGAIKTVGKGTGRGSLAAAESHAKREDPVAKKRAVRQSPPLGWCKAEGLKVQRVLEKGQPAQEVVCGPLDYVEAFKVHKQETGAGERKGADIGIEFKAIVSPDWLKESGGDPRDKDNPRVQQLIAEAVAWAESWGGRGAVYGWRYDTDERGSGVVDLFMAPVREQRHKNGSSKLVISCRKAKQELLEQERLIDPELKNSGAAMQSSWARWCQEKLDARIERGISKEETGREHVHADIYAEEANKALNRIKMEIDIYTEKRDDLQAEVERLRKRANNEAGEIINNAHALARKIVSEAQEQAKATQAASEARLEPWRAAVEALDAHEAAMATLEAEAEAIGLGDAEQALQWLVAPLHEIRDVHGNGFRTPEAASQEFHRRFSAGLAAESHGPGIDLQNFTPEKPIQAFGTPEQLSAIMRTDFWLLKIIERNGKQRVNAVAPPMLDDKFDEIRNPILRRDARNVWVNIANRIQTVLSGIARELRAIRQGPTIRPDPPAKAKPVLDLPEHTKAALTEALKLKPPSSGPTF